MNEVTNKAPLLLAAIQGAKGGSLLDSELATVVGIADRDALRSILAVMAADGQIVAIDLTDADALQAEDAGWVDGEAPLILRAALKEARTLRDRITEALVSAGVDGLEEDTLHDVLIEDVATDVPCALTEHTPDAYIQPTLDALIEAGVIRSVGCNHYAVTAAEWASRIKALIDNEGTELTAATIENLLAGTEPSR